VDEGTLIATAGSETTAWAMTITSYHLIRNPNVLTKLRRELTSVMPNETEISSWTVLEKLPYFNAVIKEGLRMAGGMLSRLPRMTDEEIV
jgi:cytochrome P450